MTVNRKLLLYIIRGLGHTFSFILIFLQQIYTLLSLTRPKMRTRKTVVNEVALLVKSAQDKNMSTGDEYDTVIDRLLAEAVEKSNDEDEPV